MKSSLPTNHDGCSFRYPNSVHDRGRVLAQSWGLRRSRSVAYSRQLSVVNITNVFKILAVFPSAKHTYALEVPSATDIEVPEGHGTVHDDAVGHFE